MAHRVGSWAALRLIAGKPRSYRIYAMPDPVIAAILQERGLPAKASPCPRNFVVLLVSYLH
ncbi:hypothetical protein C1888_28665 [Pseudomonas sp. GW531-T4]|nr:hypothetical protein C1888_28665 [Pseudomonas sp. GW531-T4]